MWAKNIKTNIRELEGAIISLIAQSLLSTNARLLWSWRSRWLKNLSRIPRGKFLLITSKKWFPIILKWMWPTLQSKTRKRHIVQARQLAMFFAKKFTKASLASIGSQIGKRDHATVLHACKTVDNLAETDKQFRKYIEDLNKKFS